MYTSPEKIRQKMRKLPTSITTEEIEEYIEKADAHINARLSHAYVTPFLVTPRLIKSLSNDLTIYFLTEDLYSSNAQKSEPSYERRYERAHEILDQILAGELELEGVKKKRNFQYGFASTNEEDPIFTTVEPRW